jgi:uncharacterized membrane protein HdeD (DUF308 family)
LIQTLSKNWLLLAVCGFLNAITSAVYLIMQNADGPLTFHSWNGTVVVLGKLAMAAGVCAIAASVWRSRQGTCWPLLLNGLALFALGLIQFGFTRFRISFLVVVLLISVMALSFGFLAVAAARVMRQQHRDADGRTLILAGAISVAFASVFWALGLRLINIEPGSHLDLLWLGFYFGFSAICLLGLALRLRSLSSPETGPREALPPLRNPKLAH